MILTISEDFTNTVTLDSELTSLPDSGLYLNTGVHPSVTVDNLLSFLPDITFTFGTYSAGTTYGKFTTTRSKTDIVLYNDVIYQSIANSNTGNTPDSSPDEWLETNLESLRIKMFALHSQDNALSKLNLTKRLITNQYLYNLVEINENGSTQLLANDYAAWVFEPKGSDYVTFTINQIALQATTATPQSLYVINQGQLVTTLTLNPNAEGRLSFEDVGYSFSGKGKWIFAIDSQNVLLDGSFVDPLRYQGFEAYTATGIGDAPEDATYSWSTNNNGLNFNISVYLNPQVYVDNNLSRFGTYLQSAWQLDVLNMYLANSNNRSNTNQRVQLDRSLLIAETKELKMGSALRTYEKEYEKAIKVISKTVDTELIDDNDGFEIVETSV